MFALSDHTQSPAKSSTKQWSKQRFFIWNETIFKLFHLSSIFFSRHENIFKDFEEIFRNSSQIKAKIVVEVWNIQNFRLRRAKMQGFMSIFIQNRWFFWAKNCFISPKLKNTGSRSRTPLDQSSSSLLSPGVPSKMFQSILKHGLTTEKKYSPPLLM